MNIEKRFCDITLFLRNYSELINTEPLRYPNGIPKEIRPWVEQIKALTQNQRLELENELTCEEITNQGYKNFLSTIKDLTRLEKSKIIHFSIPTELGRKISAKKKHEISQIKNYLDQKDFHKIIDIGSGAGHLSSILINDNNKEAICLDQEEKFQQIGLKKLERFSPKTLERMTFKKRQINKNSALPIAKDSLLIGLHSCGDLSTDLIDLFISSQKGSLLNYGCCYHKLSEDSLHLSACAKEKTFNLTSVALNLAAKCYKKITIQDVEKRKKVKRFRYALHLLNSSLLSEEFRAVGNGLKADYETDFSEYINKFAPELFAMKKREELNAFFKSTEVQNKIEDLLALGLIRVQIGRLIELYIILDRALYLKENGLDIELRETFDPILSPRNIALYASFS